MTAAAPAKAGMWPWPGLILVLLGMQVILCAVAIHLALQAPGGEVVPDYHRKALEWDRRNGEGH